MRLSDAAARRDLRERAARAREALRKCDLCPRRCGVDRLAGEIGYCGLGAEARVFREALHYGEEAELNPSHQVYFAGCNLRCEWCAVADWNLAPRSAPEMDAVEVRRRIGERLKEGARTLNLLGGEPTVSLPGILGMLAGLRHDARVVWNSNMYFGPRAEAFLDGVVDVYLADFKVGNADCAERLLGAADYVRVAKGALRFARRTADLIVRYLVIPGHADCCMTPIFRWLKRTMPDVKVSLRLDYLPPLKAVHAPPEPADAAELDAAARRARKAGLRLLEPERNP